VLLIARVEQATGQRDNQGDRSSEARWLLDSSRHQREPRVEGKLNLENVTGDCSPVTYQFIPFDSIRSNYDFEQQALVQSGAQALALEQQALEQPGAHCLADLQQVPLVEQHLLLLQLLLQPVIRPKAKINDASKPSFFMSLIL